MLHAPKNEYDFAEYTSKRGGFGLGYEYEIDAPFQGAPGNSKWMSYENEDYEQEFKRSKTRRHVIRDLPNHFKVSYEELGGGMGYEIKSVVAPLSIHKMIAKRYLFPNITTNNKPNGRDNGGGIHVSISRTPLTEPNHERVFDFLHRRFPAKLLSAMSERCNYSLVYCRQEEHEHNWGNHYSIINRENQNRHEFRLFAAQKHLLIPALEMLDSLFAHAQTQDPITVETWHAFTKSKLKYREIYEHTAKALLKC